MEVEPMTILRPDNHRGTPGLVCVCRFLAFALDSVRCFSTAWALRSAAFLGVRCAAAAAVSAVRDWLLRVCVASFPSPWA